MKPEHIKEIEKKKNAKAEMEEAKASM